MSEITVSHPSSFQCRGCEYVGAGILHLPWTFMVSNRSFILFRSSKKALWKKKSVCMCVCVCLNPSVWASPNVEPEPFDHASLNSICSSILQSISTLFFVSFAPTPEIKGSSHKKKFKISIFSKMDLTIFIKFCGFIEHSKSNNLILSDFIGKFPEGKKNIIIFRILSEVQRLYGKNVL